MNAISAMNDGEVRSRLEAIERYNDYFRRELDEKGNPLTHHIVGPQQLWNIMTREWHVDPTKFGVQPPPPSKYEAKPVPAIPTGGSHGI